jgi:NAD(P)-dependent dehydrogenase (short-subunit alcohol dehydrogenase family)
VQAALGRFSRIDALVNNAGNLYAGYFEQLAPEQIERSLTTNLVGRLERLGLEVVAQEERGERACHAGHEEHAPDLEQDVQDAPAGGQRVL